MTLPYFLGISFLHHQHTQQWWHGGNWTESQAERCPSGGVVILHRFCGRTGNRFLQYTFARLLAEEQTAVTPGPPSVPACFPSWFLIAAFIGQPEMELELQMEESGKLQTVCLAATSSTPWPASGFTEPLAVAELGFGLLTPSIGRWGQAPMK